MKTTSHLGLNIIPMNEHTIDPVQNTINNWINQNFLLIDDALSGENVGDGGGGNSPSGIAFLVKADYTSASLSELYDKGYRIFNAGKLTLDADSSIVLENCSISADIVTVPSKATLALSSCEIKAKKLLVNGILSTTSSNILANTITVGSSGGIQFHTGQMNAESITLSGNWEIEGNINMGDFVINDGYQVAMKHAYGMIRSVSGTYHAETFLIGSEIAVAKNNLVMA